MPILPPDDFMYEAWGYDTNPFPSNTVNTSVDLINEAVFSDEYEAVRGGLVRDAAATGRPIGFLWSVPPVPGGEDTGLGKTGTLRRVAWTTNEDWGASLFTRRQRERLRENAPGERTRGGSLRLLRPRSRHKHKLCLGLGSGVRSQRRDRSRWTLSRRPST
jgi:hypothetical protein